MNLVFGSNRLRATTVAIDDPGPLLRFLPLETPHSAFLRQDDGFIAIGEVDRFETDTADAADVWWSEAASNIDHDSELPGRYGVGPLAVGSFCFDPDSSCRRSTLIVPRIIVGRREGQAWLTKVDGDSQDFSLPEVGEALLSPKDVRLCPGTLTEQQWTQMVDTVVTRIRAGELDKAVLARDLLVRAAEPLDGRTLLHRLTRLYPMCYSYLVNGLVGATPELLIRRRAGLATSRVLAGTVSHNNGDYDDATELRRSAKDIAEHEFAVASVAQAIAPYCSAMNVPEAPFVLELPNVMHLASDITGVCDAQTSALMLTAALHPTAAVCGTPTASAMHLISELEGIDRGGYAGPVGWIDMHGDGEWALALRGGQIRPEDPCAIQLFAGCGIVADSHPASELAETKAKFMPMLQALELLM